MHPHRLDSRSGQGFSMGSVCVIHHDFGLLCIDLRSGPSAIVITSGVFDTVGDVIYKEGHGASCLEVGVVSEVTFA